MTMSVIVPRKPGPPPLPASLITRAELVRQISQASAGRLTRLIAPPGSGKSVALAQWGQANQDRPIGWFFIDPVDTDAVKFAVHFIDAFRAIDPTLGDGAIERVETTGLRLGPVFL